MLKKIIFLAALGYAISLGTVSLMTLSGIPDVQISFADKIFHFLAYSLFTILWYMAFFYSFRLQKRKSIQYAVVFAILFGMVVEVLQGTVTASRAFDLFDALANTLGALVVAIIIWFKNNLYVKNS